MNLLWSKLTRVVEKMCLQTSTTFLIRSTTHLTLTPECITLLGVEKATVLLTCPNEEYDWPFILDMNNGNFKQYQCTT